MMQHVSTHKIHLLILFTMMLAFIVACAPGSSSVVEPVLPAAAPVSPDVSQDNVDSEFVGQVEKIDQDSWTVDGKDVAVSGETEVDSDIEIGDTVKVHALNSEDGLIVAREINLLAGLDSQSFVDEVISNDDDVDDIDDDVMDDDDDDVMDDDDDDVMDDDDDDVMDDDDDDVMDDDDDDDVMDDDDDDVMDDDDDDVMDDDDDDQEDVDDDDDDQDDDDDSQDDDHDDDDDSQDDHDDDDDSQDDDDDDDDDDD